MGKRPSGGRQCGSRRPRCASKEYLMHIHSPIGDYRSASCTCPPDPSCSHDLRGARLPTFDFHTHHVGVYSTLANNRNAKDLPRMSLVASLVSVSLRPASPPQQPSEDGLPLFRFTQHLGTTSPRPSSPSYLFTPFAYMLSSFPPCRNILPS